MMKPHGRIDIQPDPGHDSRRRSELILISVLAVLDSSTLDKVGPERLGAVDADFEPDIDHVVIKPFLAKGPAITARQIDRMRELFPTHELLELEDVDLDQATRTSNGREST